MLSKVIYTAPELENDTEVIIELTTEKKGFKSDPIEVTLTAKGFDAPSAPVIEGASEVQENQTLTLNYTVDEKATLKGQADKGTLTIGETIEFVAPEVESDEEATLTFYAQRGTKVSETITKTIAIKNVEVKSDAPIVKGTPEGFVNEDINVEFTNVVGTLAIKGNQEGFTATVEGNKVKVNSSTESTYTFSVTQTESGKTESDATEVTVTVKAKPLEKSATLTTSSATEVQVDSTIDIEFDNVVGTLKVSEVSEGIEAQVSGTKVQVTGKTEGQASFKVTQTESGKTESDALTVTITVSAKAQEQTEQSEGSE